MALDLYCGAGLVADGLLAAGCAVVGVDLFPQPRFPGPFLQHDALSLDPRFLDMFRFIWASPPCLKDTVMKHAPGAKGDAHPDLIAPTRQVLQRWAARTGGKYVIENVETAPLLNPVTLCGSMFGLGVSDGGLRYHLERHRKFETNWPLAAPCACRHMKPVVGVYGGHARNRSKAHGGRSTRDPWTRSHPEIMAEAMGVERLLTGAEISQGIPPAYARFIAEQLQRHLNEQRIAA